MMSGMSELEHQGIYPLRAEETANHHCHNKLFFLLLLFSSESLGLSSLRCLGELFSLRFQRRYKIEEELRVALHPGGDAATQSEFYHKTGENKDANLVIFRRPSCFGSDEERAAGKGMLRMRRLVGPPNTAYGSPDVTEKENRFL